MNEEDFKDLTYDHLIIDGTKAKISVKGYLIIVTEIPDEPEVIFTIFTNCNGKRDFLIAGHAPLDKLIAAINEI